MICRGQLGAYVSLVAFPQPLVHHPSAWVLLAWCLSGPSDRRRRVIKSDVATSNSKEDRPMVPVCGHGAFNFFEVDKFYLAFQHIGKVWHLFNARVPPTPWDDLSFCSFNLAFCDEECYEFFTQRQSAGFIRLFSVLVDRRAESWRCCIHPGSFAACTQWYIQRQSARTGVVLAL